MQTIAEKHRIPLLPAGTARTSAGVLRPLVVYDQASEPVARHLASILSLDIIALADLEDGALEHADFVVLADLKDVSLVRAVRRGLGRIEDNGHVRAFAISPTGAARHADEVQANALGATSLIKRDILLPQLQQMCSIARRDPLDPARLTELRRAAGGEAIVATGRLLADTFGDFASGAPIVTRNVEQLGHDVIASIATVGAEDWLASVRDYHEGTFQHCLLVAGTVASFANLHVKTRENALRLTTAALLHDIGKAAVPLHILDKPGKLTVEEFEAIKLHPAAGYQHLVRQPDIDPQVLDAVRHHHEALDGSGYPDGLKGSQIAPLTRVLTVCDIFAAMVEARSYKPAKSADDAIAILVQMALDGKVDYQMVRGLAEAFAIQTPGTLAEVKLNLMELRR